VSGLRHWGQLLTDTKGPKAWQKVFPAGPSLVQALAGVPGQPGVWGWIETWGTAAGADRGTYTKFLIEASQWLGIREIAAVSEVFEESKTLWRSLADMALPDEVAPLAELKVLHSRLSETPGSGRAELQDEIIRRTREASESEEVAKASSGIRQNMSACLEQIVRFEERAFRQLQAALPSK